MVGGGRAGRKGDGDGDEGGQEGEAEHDAVAVGWVSVDDGNELMADGGGGGDLYCHVLLLPPASSPRATGRVNVAPRADALAASNNPQLRSLHGKIT